MGKFTQPMQPGRWVSITDASTFAPENPAGFSERASRPSQWEVVMTTWSKFAGIAMAGCLCALVAGTAVNAAEITVVAGGGPLPDVLGTLMPMFESATGNKVKISFKGGPAVNADVKQGAADLVITNTEVVDELAKAGDVAATGKTLLMISKVGIGVKAGAAKPDVSTPEKLKAALLAAKTVGYSQGASGQHFLTVIDKLGIADAVKRKGVIAQGRPVGAEIASGEAEIGVQQVAELRPVAGVDVIGEMPAELQKQIPYSAGIPAKAKDAATAQALVNFLRSQAALDVLKRKGMDLP
jgi:molybdate transport system substrate-binding protein